jgi:polyisoprenyl-phosphate glycosyltransferase
MFPLMTAQVISPPLLSIIVPAFNEGENIDVLLPELIETLNRIDPNFEILLIDDGSKDDTLARIRRHSEADPRLHALAFSRNFGKEVALAAGIDHALGQAVVIIDADLQHPPELIARFVEKWREGYDQVYGKRMDRAIDGWTRRWLTEVFYKAFARFGEIPLPEGAGDFRLMDRKVVDNLKQLGEHARFTKGLYAWVGFKTIGVPFEMRERYHGTSKWGYRKLTRFAFDGLSSFSTMPLRLATYIGLFVSMLAFGFGAVILAQTLLFGNDVPGFASLILSVLFFSGLQLIFLGMLGEYIGRIFSEVKRRPLYIIAETIGGAAKIENTKPKATASKGASPAIEQKNAARSEPP